MADVPWYKWPQTRGTGLVPWYTIIRRALCWPFMVLGMAITFTAIWAGFGFKEARTFWRNV